MHGYIGRIQPDKKDMLLDKTIGYVHGYMMEYVKINRKDNRAYKGYVKQGNKCKQGEEIIMVLHFAKGSRLKVGLCRPALARVGQAASLSAVSV